MRPEGWENPLEELTPVYWEGFLLKQGNDYKAYEAGADAMLEGIWKMAKESPTGTFTFDTHQVNCPSVLGGNEMAIRESTPISGGALIDALHATANALYTDLKQDCSAGDKAFETRIHTLILMLTRFEVEMKRGG